MPKKKLGKDGRSFASFPSEIYDLAKHPEKLPELLKKIEAQIRQTAKYDHDTMRRADGARILAYLRVMALVGLESMVDFLQTTKGKERADMLKYLFNLLYNDNRERMDELLELTAADFKRAEPTGTPVKTIADRIKDGMGTIGGKKAKPEPETEQEDEDAE